MLGIRLVDTDVFDVPLILTDPYGHFKPGPNGFPQLVLTNGNCSRATRRPTAARASIIPANARQHRPCLPERHRAQRGARAPG